jgi:hypothetical protein
MERVDTCCMTAWPEPARCGEDAEEENEADNLRRNFFLVGGQQQCSTQRFACFSRSRGASRRKFRVIAVALSVVCVLAQRGASVSFVSSPPHCHQQSATQFLHHGTFLIHCARLCKRALRVLVSSCVAQLSKGPPEGGYRESCKCRSTRTRESHRTLGSVCCSCWLGCSVCHSFSPEVLNSVATRSSSDTHGFSRPRLRFHHADGKRNPRPCGAVRFAAPRGRLRPGASAIPVAQSRAAGR